MKRFQRTFQRFVPVLLLAAAPGFAGNIGSMMEATTDAALLIETDWGIPQGSFVLSLEQLYTSGGRAGVTVVPPSVTVTNSNPASAEPAAPVFVMQPNLGFQVVLTADFAFQGWETPIENPGRIVLAVVPSAPSSLGVSDEFTTAPISNDVSAAGMLYMGDSRTAPSILTSSMTSASRPAGSTPTADGSTPAYSSGQLDRVAAAVAINSVPEPATSICVTVALMGLGWMKYRSKRR